MRIDPSIHLLCATIVAALAGCNEPLSFRAHDGIIDLDRRSSDTAYLVVTVDSDPGTGLPAPVTPSIVSGSSGSFRVADDQLFVFELTQVLQCEGESCSRQPCDAGDDTCPIPAAPWGSRGLSVSGMGRLETLEVVLWPALERPPSEGRADGEVDFVRGVGTIDITRTSAQADYLILKARYRADGGGAGDTRSPDMIAGRIVPEPVATETTDGDVALAVYETHPVLACVDGSCVSKPCEPAECPSPPPPPAPWSLSLSSFEQSAHIEAKFWAADTLMTN